MTQRAVAIRLKIPDNEAYTALTALRRLGVDVAKLERAEIWIFDDDGDAGTFVERVERNETLFNPNKHQLRVLPESQPGPGEVWIEELDAREVPVRVAGVRSGRRSVAWRLFVDGELPADAATVRDAAEKLLCNPAIERPRY